MSQYSYELNIEKEKEEKREETQSNPLVNIVITDLQANLSMVFASGSILIYAMVIAGCTWSVYNYSK